MFKTLRTKLLVGIAPLLIIMIGLGLWAIAMFYRLGGNIDVILRENYRSVRAAEDMKEALERMDSAALFAIGGQEQRARSQSLEYRPKFEAALKVEQGNVTLPGEQELADDLTELYRQYGVLTDRLFAPLPDQGRERNQLYFGELLPLFDRIKGRADRVLDINQRNMEEMDLAARNAAARAMRLMVVALALATAVGGGVALLLSRSILEPIRIATRAARAISKGDLDQVVPVLTRDELGELASAFNAMARTVRQFRAAGTANLLRAQRTAQATIDSFPDPVVVVDTAGQVERANPAARRILRVTPDGGPPVPWFPPPALHPALADVLGGHPDHLPAGVEHAIAFRDDGQERYFLPRVLAIRDDDSALLGAAVVLSDVTKFRLGRPAQERHGLHRQPRAQDAADEHADGRPPAAGGSRRPSHDPKQIELLMAAREDSDRLLAMVNDLLDLTRIEQGRLRLDVKPGGLGRPDGARPSSRFEVPGPRLGGRFGGRGLTTAAAGGRRPRTGRARLRQPRRQCPGVHAPRRLGSALGGAGGRRRASVRFAVADTGVGIAAEHLPKVFERFYRVPGPRLRGRCGAGPGDRAGCGRGARRPDRGNEPCRPGDDRSASPCRPPRPRRRGTVPVPRGGEQSDEPPAIPRILIVDDEPNVRLVFRTALEGPGRTVESVADGEAALLALAAGPADLVLLDLQMPILGGMEVLRRLREAGNDVPVAIITAHGRVPDAVDAMKLGAIDFLSKPLSPETLRSVVDDVLARHTRLETAGPSATPAAGTDPLARAKFALNRRDFDEADAELRRAVARAGASAEAHNLLGVLNELRGDPAGAYRHYRAALKAERRYEPARNNMQRHYEKFTFGSSTIPVDVGIPPAGDKE